MIAIIFTWIGFVRTGLGFGGAVLGLPILMLIGGSPIDWLPIIGIHLLFFSSITLSNSLRQVDWQYLKKSLPWILPAKIIGVIGLLSLPPNVMTIIVYLITILYSLTWINNSQIISKKTWVNNLLLFFGGYLSGTSLMGGVLLVAVYMNHIDLKKLRNTLFVLWFFLVSIKMVAFMAVGVYIVCLFFLMLGRPPRSSLNPPSEASVVYKSQRRNLDNFWRLSRIICNILCMLGSVGCSRCMNHINRV